jgi:hypothetical protein
VIEAVLLLLSLILMATTVFPSLDVDTFALVGGAVMVTGLIVFAVLAARSRRRAGGVSVSGTEPAIPREQWTMPPIALLARPKQSVGRRVTMLALEAYLLMAIVLLIVKAIQLAGG